MMRIVYPSTAIGFLIYFGIVWFLSNLLTLQGGEVIVFRVVLIAVGMAAAILVILLFQKRQRRMAAASNAIGDIQKDIQFLIREANSQLAAARQIHKGGKKLADLPLILFLGEHGSAKTSLIVNSGLEPELLAGLVHQDNSIIPTRIANLWMAHGTVLAEAGGDLLKNAAALSIFVRMLRSRKLANFLGRGTQSARAVVMCCECPSLTAPDATNALAATARHYQAILGSIAQNWGSRVPVYVVLTKLDQLGEQDAGSRFADYVRFFTPQETPQAFGVTLAMLEGPGGTYNERQTNRLTDSFEGLFGPLADKRLDYLRRENDPARLPNIYEFPREFRKMRDTLVRFLVDVCRPSQLRATPYLRGFYFSGIRRVLSDEASPSAPSSKEHFSSDAGATRVFSSSHPSAAFSTSFDRPSGRSVTEWVFVRDLCEKIILGDRAARTASGHDTRAWLIRRMLYATVAGVALIWIAGATVSYSNNRSLMSRVAAAARTLGATPVTPNSSALPETLRQLDVLRGAAAEVTRYDVSGAPMSFRWGLYPGKPLYTGVRKLYCRELERVLLADTRGGLESYFRTLPPSPQSGDDYDKPFRSLKAYLMMTSEGARSEAGFLADTLTDRWVAGKSIATEQRSLGHAQFAFYASERANDFCGAQADAAAVAQARTYLLGFQPVEQVYRNILADISSKGPAVRFEDPAGAVLNDAEVPYPYTKAAWQATQSAIRNASQYFSQDPWVLMAGAPPSTAATTGLQEMLSQRYLADYASRWQEFLNAASISAYRGFDDAAKKLEAITATQSSLLRLFCTISTNTNVEAPAVTKQFQEIHRLQPPATCVEKKIDMPVQQYVQEMMRLQVQVDAIARRTDTANASIDSLPARMAARTTAQNFNLPRKAEDLLMDPITRVDALVERAGPQALNAKGSDFCQATRVVFNSFPFRRDAADEVKIDDFNRVFQPNTGQFAKFYEETLKDLLISDGIRFAPKSGAKLRVAPGYVQFLNNAAAISNAFFPNNSPRPRLVYSVRALQSTNIQNFNLQIDDKTISGTGNTGGPEDFIWAGEEQRFSLVAAAKESSQPLRSSGPWALFRFLSAANTSSGGSTFEYHVFGQVSIGRAAFANSPQGILRLQFDSKTAPGILGRMLGMGCVSRIAQ